MIRMDDTLEATARLLRKGFGPGSTFSAAFQMAVVSSGVGTGEMETFTTTTISKPIVRGSYMYFVELDLPPGNNMQVLGAAPGQPDRSERPVRNTQ
jgi:hypothetical protein